MPPFYTDMISYLCMSQCWFSYSLLWTHLGQDKMAAIFQTTFSSAFYWMKLTTFTSRFHWFFFSKDPINNISPLVQLMAWRRPGDKSLSEPMVFNLLIHIWQNYVSRRSVDDLLYRLSASSFKYGTDIKTLNMKTSSNGNIFRVTGHLCGNSPVSGEFPAQRPVMRSFDVFFDLHPNERLSKQWWGLWFGTSSCPLWRHLNDKKWPLDVFFCTLNIIVIWLGWLKLPITIECLCNMHDNNIVISIFLSEVFDTLFCLVPRRHEAIFSRWLFLRLRGIAIIYSDQGHLQIYFWQPKQSHVKPFIIVQLLNRERLLCTFTCKHVTQFEIYYGETFTFCDIMKP